MDLLCFILRLPFMLVRGVCRVLGFLWRRVLLRILKPLIGDFQWQSPGWLRVVAGAGARTEQWVGRHALGVTSGIILLLVAGAAAWYGYNAYLNRPKPIEPAPLVVKHSDIKVIPPSFPNYRSETPKSQVVMLRFSEPAAPIEQIGKAVTAGVTLAPPQEGAWRWQDEKTLVFTAAKHFPLGERYQVQLDTGALLAPQVKVSENKLSFTVPAFTARIAGDEFYQDPQDPSKKNAIFHIRFNAPVEVTSFERQISLTTAETRKPLRYTVNYDEKRLEAWVRSEPLALENDASRVLLEIGKGVKAAVAGNATSSAQRETVAVPGVYSLKVDDVETTVVESGDSSPGRRALMVSVNDAVKDKDIRQAVKVWLLPQHSEKQKEAGNDRPDAFYSWSLGDIDNDVIARAQTLTLNMDDAEQEYQPAFSFNYDAPANRWLLVEVDNVMTSAGGYRLKDSVYRVVQVPDFPQTLRFVSDGSLLSMHGEKRITVATRNVPGMKLDVRRVIPGQLQHIASFKSGIFTSVDFNRLGAEYFTEHFQEKVAVSGEENGALNYQGIDLSRYLASDAHARRGIFLLTLTPWDPEKQARQTEADEEDREEEEEESPADSRFIVVTDLGIIAKQSIDDGRDVFVQSIYSGQPVEGAKVSVIARNGTPLFIRTTGADGHAAFPSVRAFSNEKTPVMLLVEKEGDVSFLPFRVYDRSLDFSRFDTGGEVNSRDPRALGSYLFSDRGVYRPGDTFNIGMITRTADWSTSLDGVPLRAEIRDPRDTLMQTVPVTLDKAGFNEVSYTTEENSPTGEWSVYLYLNGKNEDDSRLLGYTTVNVKEFEPDQMKVALTLTPDRKAGWVKPQELKAVIDVQNLFGTPAQERRVTSKLTLRPVYPHFDKYPDYAFYEHRTNNDGFESELEDQKTDADGKATIPLDLKSYADASYQLQLLSEAFEPGSGRSVAATARTLVSPYDYLIGVKADGDLDYVNRDAKRTLHIIAVNPSLEPVAQPDLTMTLVERKYISVLTRQDSGVYKYQSKLKEEEIATQPLSVTALGSDVPLATDKPGDYVLVVKNGAGQVLNRIDYSVAGNANVSRSLDRNAELKLKLNKGEYRPGEEIEIAINAPYTGGGLITIERDKVYAWHWFNTDTTSSVQRIKVPEDMEGNGYINVQFIRDIHSDEIFMSPLSYGVMPFRISNDARRAPLTLDSPEVIKPGENLSIKVTTDGPQRVAVFAVDEGILQVARYRLKDPLEYFFRKRQLEVDSAQILDLILPEFSKLMSLTAAPGGDGGEGMDLHLNPFKRKKDKPVAYWSGITDVNGEAEFSYPLPDYFNGKIRVMAISVTPERIGRAQRYTTVRDDVIMTPNAPATITPGDEFDVSVGVANNLQDLQGAKADVKVTVTPSEQFRVVGEPSHTLSLAEKQEGLVTFRVLALNALGEGRLTFTAAYGDKSSRRTVTTSVRPSTPYRTMSVMGRMAGQEQKVSDLRQMFDAYAKRQAMVSHSPLVLGNGLAKYLADYPYSGSEQLISRAIPLIMQDKHPEMRSALSQADIREQLRNTLSTLRARQNSRGAVGQWRSSPQTDPFVTLWTVQYLLESKEAGYPAPDGMLRDANTYLRAMAADDAMRDLYGLRLRAAAVYLLTRQGEITTNSLAAVQALLQRNGGQEGASDLASLYLAASYRMLKMEDEANRLLAPTWKQLGEAYDKAWWTQNYYDPLVQDATRLYLIVRHFPEKAREIPPQALENMVIALQEQRYTTYSSAMSILALEGYSSAIQAAQDESKPLTISAAGAEQGGQLQRISSLRGMIAAGDFTSQARTIAFNNPSPLPAWYVVTQAGYDLQPPQKAVSRGLEIVREYTDGKGTPVTQVTLGQKINVHLKIRTNSDKAAGELAIVDLLPGGFEVVQQTAPSGDAEEGDNNAGWRSPVMAAGSSWEPEFTDVREDRVILFGYGREKLQEFIYQIKPTNPGTFVIPPTFAEAVYNRDVQALSAGGGTLTVTAPQ